MATLTNQAGQTVTVPDAVAADYIAQGWVEPGYGEPTPAPKPKPRKRASRAKKTATETTEESGATDEADGAADDS